MSDKVNEGLWAWKQSENNNRMIELQAGADAVGEVRLGYFGGSAFRITIRVTSHCTMKTQAHRID